MLQLEDYAAGGTVLATVAALLVFSVFRTRGPELLGVASVVAIAAFVAVMLVVSAAAEARAKRAATSSR